ncbi:MAG: rod shape-determining protein [Candidatus Pacebacteria bacterium]|nr:rod shape-determining protein [Candidatus Paceibacterota bacterium]
MLNKLFSYLSKDLAIDLGTANSLVYLKEEGIVIFEPSVVAVNQKTGQILAVGKEAREMVGKTPAHITAIRPLVSGVISDFEVTEQMLKYFIDKVHKKKFILGPRPRIIISIPCGVTEVERKAVKDAAKSAGAREVFLIEQPIADAIGAKLPVQEPGGNFIVDIGGGMTEVAVISLGGIVLSKSLRLAGDKLDNDIVRWCQEELKLLIGERMAEQVKIKIGSAIPIKEKKEIPVRGRNLITGLPEEILISSDEAREALQKSVAQIVQEIKNTIEETPPELLADIMKTGIYLCGGGSQLRGLAYLVQKETKIPTKVVEDPMTCVVRGAGYVLEHLDELRDVLVETDELEPPR